MDVLLGIALSSHIGFQFDYNEIHPQIRLESEKYAVGAFYNSEENISLYGAKRIIINNRTKIKYSYSIDAYILNIIKKGGLINILIEDRNEL